jgi:pimeloyl-ACP methyl ester carboxylesterase
MLNVFSIVAASAVLAGVFYAAIGAWRDRRRFVPPGRLVQVGGHRLHYRCAGAGTPAVILEAGIAASSVTWSLVQPRVAEMTRVCSYDRAGLAWSDAASSPRSIDGIARELHEMLERADIAPPYVLVAHSFGALAIRAFARARPQEVAGLVFVDPLHPEEWCEPSPQQRRMLRGAIFFSRLGAALAAVGIVRFALTLLSGGAPAAPRRFSRVFGATVAAMLERLVGEVRKLPRDVLPAVQAHWSSPKSFRAMRQHLQAMPACSADLMRTVDVFGDIPVVVLSGGTRAPQWLAADAALAAASSRGRHAVSQKSGHWIHLDDPDLVIDAIRSIAAGKKM